MDESTKLVDLLGAEIAKMNRLEICRFRAALKSTLPGAIKRAARMAKVKPQRQKRNTHNAEVLSNG